MSMSEQENLEAVKTIRQLEEYSGQRATIVGLNVKANGAKYLEQGIDGYISGPLTEEKIKTHLRQIEN
jgi:CheY-like chemotaxis protein